MDQVVVTMQEVIDQQNQLHPEFTQQQSDEDEGDDDDEDEDGDTEEEDDEDDEYGGEEEDNEEEFSEGSFCVEEGEEPVHPSDPRWQSVHQDPQQPLSSQPA